MNERGFYMIDKEILNWLLAGDVSIQYQVNRDLLKINRPDLRARISKEGWGAKFLSARKNNGHWGLKFYQPKWISTHYTLLDLKHLGIATDTPGMKDLILKIIAENTKPDGGISPAGTIKESDIYVSMECF